MSRNIGGNQTSLESWKANEESLSRKRGVLTVLNDPDESVKMRIER